jgi:hypothetical protein
MFIQKFQSGHMRIWLKVISKIVTKNFWCDDLKKLRNSKSISRTELWPDCGVIMCLLQR